MKSTVLAFLACLLVLCVEGQRQRTSCKCPSGAIEHINRKIIIACEGHEPSSYCSKKELIVVTKDQKKCLNPESAVGKKIFQRCKEMANGVNPRTARSTTALDSTASVNSTTSAYTTSKL